MNIRLLRPLFPILALLLSWNAHAQCLYTLEMLDGYGDGWNGGTLTITIDGVATDYTLDNVNDDGVDSTLTFAIVHDAPLMLSYVSGFFPAEVSFRIYDNEGALFFAANAPVTDTLYTGSGQCADCVPPSQLSLDNVWDNRARIRWQPNGNGLTPPVSWRVVYGPKDFTIDSGLGDTLDVSTPKATILGLQKKTWYDAYVQQYCDTTGGYSNFAGPLSFETYWTNDIGVEAVIAPLSGCDLGQDSVKFLLKNYGAAPQSLFSFRYAVNGELAPVLPPADGFYTAILGKDSSVTVAFETLSDFSAAGEYRLDVFTELGTDEDVQNDTFTYFFTNRLQPDYLQDFEIWRGDWTPGGSNASWQYGMPSKPAIPAAASGQYAWVTSLANPYNANEASYLESPCFDFSETTLDPAIEFSLLYQTEGELDGAWLEMSFDGSQTWTRVGEIGEGINWYTEFDQNQNAGEFWSGNSQGWVKSRHLLPGAAGKSEVRLRFGFAANEFFQLGGIGIDDVRIFEPFAKDLAASSITTLGETEECGLENDQIAFTFFNLGGQTQSGIKVAYSINGGAPVTNNVTGSLAPDKSITHTFSLPFDSRDGTFEIKCWLVFPADQAHSNDTTTYFINHASHPLPTQENFEAYTAPPGDWQYQPENSFSVTNAHNNTSNVLAFNLYFGNTGFTADMPRMGKVNAGDSLEFSYRITEFATQGQTPVTLALGTRFEVQISTNCGETYQTINTIASFSHTPTVLMRTRKLSLEAFAGQDIKVRFKGTWTDGDMWFDLDNINILACPANMDLSADITQPNPGQSNGQITANVGIGNPPYTYQWSNGATGQTISGIPEGNYIVSVSDAFGCSDALAITLGNTPAFTPEDFALVSLSPNPTQGLANLHVAFAHTTDAALELLNPLGQTVWMRTVTGSARLQEIIDLNDLPAGLYLLRIHAEGRSITRKLIKQ